MFVKYRVMGSWLYSLEANWDKSDDEEFKSSNDENYFSMNLNNDNNFEPGIGLDINCLPIVFEDEESKKSELEESGSNEFKVPIYMGDFDDDVDDNNTCVIDNEPGTDPFVRENILTYRQSLKDMKKYEQDEKEIATEHLEMRKRVQAWHDKLGPILDEEEENGTDFDIHEYGTRMLNRFSKVGEQKSFNELFGGMEKEEVSRYFLSILMLTNTYNLKIITLANGEKIIELLKKERHHEELQVNVGNQVNNE